MKRFAACCAAVLALTVGAAFVGANTPEEPASISAVMKELHKGKTAPLNQLKDALKSDSPDWAAVQSAAKIYAKLAPDLPKNETPKGDQASYEKLAKSFAEQAAKLNASAQGKDLAACRQAFGKLAMSCMECHKLHKP